jgi:hypothetical protein
MLRYRDKFPPGGFASPVHEECAMDHVTTAIIAALSAGASSAIPEMAKKTIAEGYDSLKALLKKKYGTDSDVMGQSKSWSASLIRRAVNAWWRRSFLRLRVHASHVVMARAMNLNQVNSYVRQAYWSRHESELPRRAAGRVRFDAGCSVLRGR